MKFTETQQLGLQMQKFGASLQAVAIQVSNYARHFAILFAVVKVLKEKGIVTNEEIEAALQSEEKV